jgi:hypothetical protein
MDAHELVALAAQLLSGPPPATAPSKMPSARRTAPGGSPWITVHEAARRARCGVKLIYREFRAGLGPHGGALLGYFIGGVGVPAGIVAFCKATSRACNGGGSGLGIILGSALLGIIVGAVYGNYAANRETLTVIYRAP